MNWKIANQYVEKVDIVEIITKYIDLKKSGSNFFAKCPFHKDNRPSLSVSKAKQIWKCFVCDVGGNILKFIMLYENKNLNDALISLAKSTNLEIEENLLSKKWSQNAQKIIEVNEEAHVFFQVTLINNQSGQKYCHSRKLNIKTQQEFKIGFATSEKTKLWTYLLKKKFTIPEIINSNLFYLDKNEKYISYFNNRLIFPIKDENGEIIAFSGRNIENNQLNKVKYLNSKESEVFIKGNHLFNLHYVNEKFKALQTIYLVEGFMDAIRLTEHNYPSVALMGISLSSNQINLLSERYRKIIIFPDNDQPGIESALKNALLLLKRNLNVEIIINETNYDADTYLQHFKTLQELKTCHPVDFLLQNQLKKRAQIFDVEDKKKFDNLIINYINVLNEEDRAYFLPKINELTTFLPRKINTSYTKKKNNKEILWKKYVLARILHNFNLLTKIDFKKMAFNNLEFDYYLNLIEKWYNELKKKSWDNLQLNLTFNNFCSFIQSKKIKNELKKFYFSYAENEEVIKLNSRIINVSLMFLKIGFLNSLKEEKEEELAKNKKLSFYDRITIFNDIKNIKDQIFQLKKNEISD